MTLYELIYETLRGNLCAEYAVPGIEDAFMDGSYCHGKYAELISAYMRLLDRLGLENEDPDVEIIINALQDIQDYISREMFFLGVRHRELLLGKLDATEQ